MRAGNGTEEQRQTLRKFLDGIMNSYESNLEKLLKLSRMSRMVRAKESGHQVNQEQPDIVAGEIKWAFENLVDELAEVAGMDPVAFRLVNVPRPGDRLYPAADHDRNACSEPPL